MNSIEVHHLNRHCRATTQRTFPVFWFSPDGPGVTDILASRAIHGSEADSLLELLRRALKGERDTNLCGHYPNYGLRVIENDTIKFETTVCFTCENWIGVLNGEAERFWFAPGTFSELSSALQNLLPLSAEEDTALARIADLDRALEGRLRTAPPDIDGNL